MPDGPADLWAVACDLRDGHFIGAAPLAWTGTWLSRGGKMCLQMQATALTACASGRVADVALIAVSRLQPAWCLVARFSPFEKRPGSVPGSFWNSAISG